MEKLRAFVGHSFNDEDKAVIDIFLGYFDTLKEPIGLEWDHAEKAEPKELSKKVRDKMKDKDLFIGIFTKTDYRVEPNKMKHFILKRKCVSESDYTWGTSDWITQESGYALGKEMQLLFLVEEGVSMSAGLQGDMEFIRFNKERPQLCFGKINEMVGSIVQSKKKEPVLEERTAPPQDIKQDLEEGEEQEDEKISKELPGAGWLRDYVSLYESIVNEKDSDKAKTELDQIIKKHEDDKDHGEVYWRSRFHRLRCIAGDSDGFVELKKLSEANPDEPLPLSDLGYAYREYRNFPVAAQQYLKASEREKEKEEKIELVWRAAECYALDKNFPQAYNLLLAEFGHSKLDSTQYHKLNAKLAKIAQMDKNDNLFTAFAEKALEYSPADADTRFSLAYRYGEIHNDAPALYHYKILCEHNPTGTNLNNIGVAYSELNMQYKSVSSYRKASDEYKETLAMSNLAYKYIKEGFLTDAADILKKARSEEDYHKNVDSAMIRIDENKGTEDKLEEEVLRNIERERKFRVKFAEAYALPSEVSIDGEWETQHGKILLKVEGERISGNYEISPPATPAVTSRAGLLSNTLAGLGLMPTSFRKKIIKLEGKIYNRGIDYQLTITTEYPPDSPRGTSETTYEGVMCVAKDESIIEVMERVKDEKEVRFYDMKRIQDSSNA